jgi:hydrogenase expression/formation protein HypE
MRDLTRGGLATALCEVALDGRLRLELEETWVPVEAAVSGACELLGLDPLYVANEGRFLAVIDARDVERALAVLRAFEPCGQCAHVGRVTHANQVSGSVVAVTPLGSRRVLDLLSGEQLPRIC